MSHPAAELARNDFLVDLIVLAQWVLWDYDQDANKIPYCLVNGQRRKASSTNPDTWTSYDEACQQLEDNPDEFAGLGFVLVKGQGIVGVDVDDCLDEQGNVKDWGIPIVEDLHATYLERSPGGYGLKGFLFAELDSAIIQKIGAADFSP